MEQSGRQRGLAALALHREGEAQQEPGIGGRKADRDGETQPKAGDLEQRGIEQRCAAVADPARDMAPAQPAERTDRRQQRIDRQFAMIARPVHQRPQQRPQREPEQSGPHDVEPRRPRRSGAGQEGIAQADGQQPHGQVDQEDQPPAQPEQVRADQQAADDRADNGRQSADHAEHRQLCDPFERREQHLHQRHELRPHDRAGRALQQPRRDQLPRAMRNPAKHRRQREARHAQQEHAPITEAVTHPAAGQQQQRKSQRIARDHPRGDLRGRAEIGLAKIGRNRGQRGVDDGQVDDLEHQRDDERQQRRRFLARGHGLGIEHGRKG